MSITPVSSIIFKGKAQALYNTRFEGNGKQPAVDGDKSQMPAKYHFARENFINKAKSKISTTGFIAGLAGFVGTAIGLKNVNRLGIISKALISSVAGMLTSAAGMYVRSNMIVNSDEYKKLFIDNQKG